MLKVFCITKNTIVENTVYFLKNKTWKSKDNTDT